MGVQAGTWSSFKSKFSFPNKFKVGSFFCAKMGKAGWIFIPKLTLTLLQDKKPSLAGSIFEVVLEPASDVSMPVNVEQKTLPPV